MDRLVGDRRAVDEAGHEVALRPDERRDLRPDADAGRRDGRGVLDLAADPEQVRVVAGEADDPALGRSPAASTRKLRFVIPPDSARRRQVAAGELRDALHRRDELVAQLAAEDLADRRCGHVISRHEKAARRSLAAPPDPPPRTYDSADRRLAGRDVGLDRVLAAALGDDVVDRADDEHEPDEGLEDRDGGQARRARSPPQLRNVLMNGFDSARRSVPKSPKIGETQRPMLMIMNPP